MGFVSCAIAGTHSPLKHKLVIPNFYQGNGNKKAWESGEKVR
jgi:hypothetical protein